MKVNLKYIFSKIIISVLLFLFIGIKYDREFSEPRFFIKYRPTFKIEFYSPVGERDVVLSQLNSSDRKEELVYQEYIENNKNSLLDQSVFLLVPLVSLLFLSSLLQVTTIIKKRESLKTLLLGYVSHLILYLLTFAIYWSILGLKKGISIIITFIVLSTLALLIIYSNFEMNEK